MAETYAEKVARLAREQDSLLESEEAMARRRRTRDSAVASALPELSESGYRDRAGAYAVQRAVRDADLEAAGNFVKLHPGWDPDSVMRAVRDQRVSGSIDPALIRSNDAEAAARAQPWGIRAARSVASGLGDTPVPLPGVATLRDAVTQAGGAAGGAAPPAQGSGDGTPGTPIPFAPGPTAPPPTRGGGTFTIPAHEDQLIAPEREAGIAGAMSARQDAEAARGRAAQNENIAAAEGQEQLAELSKNQAGDVQERAWGQDAELARTSQMIDDESRKVSEMKVDPDRWWRSKNTGQQISIGIGAALTAFSMGWGKMNGDPLANVHRAIDNDIDAQKHEIELRRGRVNDMKGMLAEQYKRFGNMDQALSATRALAYQSAQQQVAAMSIKAKDPTIQAASAAAQADLSKSNQEELARFHSYHAAVTGRVAASTDSPEGQEYKLGPDEMTLPLDGTTHIVVNKNQAEDVSKAARGYQGAKAAADRLIALSNAGPAERATPRWQNQVKAQMGAFTQAEILSGGKGGQGIMEKMESAVGGAYGPLHVGMRSAVESALAGVRDRRDAALSASGGAIVEPTLKRNKSGQLETTYLYRGRHQQQEERAPIPLAPISTLAK